MRTVFVTTAPLPYQTPIFNELHEMVDLHVIYLDVRERVNNFREAWGVQPRFEYSIHRCHRFIGRKSDARVWFSTGTARLLSAIDPDGLFVLSWDMTMVEPLLWARARRLPSVMWAESTHCSGLLRGRASNAYRRFVVRQASAFVTNGSLATAYLTELGAHPSRIVTSRLPAARHAQRELRAIEEETYPQFLFVGRLIPRKHPVELIRAFRRVVERFPGGTLLIVGEGPLRAECERCAASYAGAVRMLGHVEGEELSDLYANSHILVLPAEREVWGLVINEALAHGLFVVATDEVGSARDLVNEKSGLLVSARQLTSSLGGVLIKAAELAGTDQAVRAARAACVAGVTPRQFAEDAYSAFLLAVSGAASVGSLIR